MSSGGRRPHYSRISGQLQETHTPPSVKGTRIFVETTPTKPSRKPQQTEKERKTYDTNYPTRTRGKDAKPQQKSHLANQRAVQIPPPIVLGRSARHLVRPHRRQRLRNGFLCHLLRSELRRLRSSRVRIRSQVLPRPGRGRLRRCLK